MIRLSKRLETIAGFVDPAKRIIDVGTDHGYLPVYFALKGLSLRIAASDINKDPLARARLSAEEHGFTDKIEFFLSDGLRECGEGYDEVIIAGMGGDTIISILENAPWTRNNVHLILQPQSKIEKLCDWLCNNGYSSDNAKLVNDQDKMYCVISVWGREGEVNSSPVYELLWKHLLSNRDIFAKAYFSDLAKKCEWALSGMEKGNRTESSDYKTLKQTYNEIIRINKEILSW